MVSIIVPIYNSELYLEACVGSIIAQSFVDWELILINDGSTDSSGIIADRIALNNKKIKVIHTDNAGPSSARNIGLEVAHGDYIFFVDSDDLISRDSIKILYEIAKSTNADIIEGDFCYSEKELPKKLKFQSGKMKIFTPEKAIENVLYQKELLPSVSGKLFKTELFQRTKFTFGIYYEDLNIFYHLFRASNKIVFYPAKIYFYRKTPGSILHTWNSRRLDVLKVTQNLEKYINKYYPSLSPAARDRRLSANFNLFALAKCNEDKEIMNNCWEVIRQYRIHSLFNIKVRLKNKIGILLSFLGKPCFALLCKFAYKDQTF